MKSNYRKKMPITTTAEQVETAVKAEVNKLYDKIGFGIAAQILAVVLRTLEADYGWKEKRLKEFVGNLHATADLTFDGAVFGKNIDTEMLLQHIKSKYGIDLREEVRSM